MFRLESNMEVPMQEVVFSYGRLDTWDRSQIISRQVSLFAKSIMILSVIYDLVTLAIYGYSSRRHMHPMCILSKKFYNAATLVGVSILCLFGFG